MGAQATATVEQAWLASSALPGGLDGHAATVAGAVFAVAGSAPVQRRVAPPARAELAAVVSMLNALNAVDPFVTRLILSRTPRPYLVRAPAQLRPLDAEAACAPGDRSRPPRRRVCGGTGYERPPDRRPAVTGQVLRLRTAVRRLRSRRSGG